MKFFTLSMAPSAHILPYTTYRRLEAPFRKSLLQTLSLIVLSIYPFVYLDAFVFWPLVNPQMTCRLALFGFYTDRAHMILTEHCECRGH